MCHFKLYESQSAFPDLTHALTSAEVYSTEITSYQAFTEDRSGALKLAEPLYDDDHIQSKQPTMVPCMLKHHSKACNERQLTAPFPLNFKITRRRRDKM